MPTSSAHGRHRAVERFCPALCAAKRPRHRNGGAVGEGPEPAVAVSAILPNGAIDGLVIQRPPGSQPEVQPHLVAGSHARLDIGGFGEPVMDDARGGPSGDALPPETLQGLESHWRGLYWRP